MFLFLAVPRSIIPRFNLTLRGSELILASPKEFQAIGLQGPEPSIVVRACHRGHVDCAVDVDQRNVQLINQGALLVGVGILEGFTSNLANASMAYTRLPSELLAENKICWTLLSLRETAGIRAFSNACTLVCT